MTANIMKANGEVVHLTTYREFKEEKKSNHVHIQLRREFDNIIRDNVGPDISPDNFQDVNLEDMPLYEMYQENTTYAEVGLKRKTEDNEDPVMATRLDRNVPTPEVNKNM